DCSRFSAQPLTILGVTGPFCILSERIYHLCVHTFHVRPLSTRRSKRWLRQIFNIDLTDSVSTVHGMGLYTCSMDALVACCLQCSRLDNGLCNNLFHGDFLLIELRYLFS